ncbi:DeoR family transcriptional regulator [Streptomyces cellulosae]
MSAITARRLRREQLRRLTEAEPGLSHRALAQRLGVSKDTVRRDLEAMAQQALRRGATAAPQAVEGGASDAAPGGAPAPRAVERGAAEPAPGGAPAPQPVEGGAVDAAPGGAPVPLPRRSTAGQLVLDLADRPGLRRDLALLAQTGCTAEDLVTTAVRVLAAGYGRGLAAGHVRPGRPFAVTGVSVGPLSSAPRVTAAPHASAS